jgi:hypothetical protein
VLQLLEADEALLRRRYALRARITTFETLPLDGRQPDLDRPPLRHLARHGREHAIRRRAERRTTSAVDAGGRWVDADVRDRSQARQRKKPLSRRKLEDL